MATRVELVEFICSRLQKLGIVRYRKMFGDYMVYLNEKPVILLCDNIAYVKKHPGIAGIMENAETGIPYNGAKEHYILDVDHEDSLLKVVGALEKILPYPGEKKRKAPDHALRGIPNVGERTRQDLLAMGYTSIDSLRGKKAEDLYDEECRLRGCTVDRCQLYLYRALEYFLNSENPDPEKCKWWYWKDDFFYPSPCGAVCVECPRFPRACRGCRAIKGKVFWLQYTGHETCPIWQCCKDGKRKDCGGCPELPCTRFMKDPSISDEENAANLKKMLDNLVNRKK